MPPPFLTWFWSVVWGIVFIIGHANTVDVQPRTSYRKPTNCDASDRSLLSTVATRCHNHRSDKDHYPVQVQKCQLSLQRQGCRPSEAFGIKPIRTPPAPSVSSRGCVKSGTKLDFRLFLRHSRCGRCPLSGGTEPKGRGGVRPQGQQSTGAALSAGAVGSRGRSGLWLQMPAEGFGGGSNKVGPGARLDWLYTKYRLSWSPSGL